MIRFDKIIIEGFTSMVYPIEFVLNQPGLNQLKGKVGAGKTTVPSALVWVLFGSTLKDKSQVQTWKEIQPEGFKGTKVEVQFNHYGTDIKIIRCLKYKGKINIDNKKTKGNSDIYIFIDGKYKTDYPTKGKRGKQSFIDNLLGYSFDLFKNSIIFGQKMKRIIEESGPDKKKIFEEAFDLEFIQQAKEEAENKLDKYRKVRIELGTKLASKNDKYSMLKDSLEDALENEKKFKSVKKERLSNLKDELKDVKNDIDLISIRSFNEEKYQAQVTKVDKLHKEYTNVEEQHEDIEYLKNEIDKDKAKLTIQKGKLKTKPKLCPSCNQPLSDKGYKSLKDTIKSNIKDLESNIKRYKANLKITKTPPPLKQIEKKLDIEKDKLKDLEHSKKLITKDNERLKLLKDRLKTKQKTYDKIKSEKLVKKSPRIKTKLDKLESEVSKLENKINKLDNTLSLYNWVLKDPLSNDGLKVYIFDSLLAQVNDKLLAYGKSLGFTIEFGIDLSKKRKDFYQMIMKDDIIIPYEDLSGGQKQLVDTSVAFAIHDVITEIRPINILFIDEPFESLGINEIEIIEEIVENKAKDKCLFVITHQAGFNPLNVNEIKITLDEKGISNIL